ncbi:MAG: Gfo/Idh/MocA family protein [Candidatus Brocadiia bacterium]
MIADALNVGIVGAAGRGASFRAALETSREATIHAVCDVNEEALDEAMDRLGANEKYTDYGEMLDSSDVDAVVIGTPMQFHAPQAIAALKKNIHVLSEVTAGVSIEECRELTETAAGSEAVYMMAENYTYTRANVLVRSLAQKGFFGEPYYAEGEYLHELKGLNEITRWRRKWQTGINGITYPTHSLGPIFQWFGDQRVTEVCCAGSGHHYIDPRGDEYENEDSVVMLGRMSGGGLVKIRVDMLSDRPHAMNNYQLQGTDGSYESARAPGEMNRVWLRELHGEPNEWHDLNELTDEYMPEIWRNPPEEAKKAGHGGGDYFEVLDWLNAIFDRESCPIGIHRAMDMTLPGLVSQQSIQNDGQWLKVPDSRQWVAGM